MKADAHYYAVLAFCRACGFTKEYSYQVAYASQFVDDAVTNLIYISGDVENIDHDTIGHRPCFFNMATCHNYLRINTFNYSAMMSNTSAFHFVPGCEGTTFTKKLRCSEESPVIDRILRDVMKEDDPILLGIVLHPFADTFSHQGFSGLLSKVNDIIDVRAESKIPWELLDRVVKFFKFFIRKEKKFDHFVDSALPAYGHAQAFSYPDLPYLTWSYKYDKSDNYANAMHHTGSIRNRNRYRKAFEKIQEHLENYGKKHPMVKDPLFRYDKKELLFDTLLAVKTDRGREKNWKKFLVREGLFTKNNVKYLNYSRHDWLIEAFKNFDKNKYDARTIESATLRDDFKESYWYRYYKGVRWYKERFFKYCRKEKLDIPL